jgi:HlyD family secretion protein
MAGFVSDPRAAIRRLNLIGIAAIAVLVGGIGGWAATSHIAGAVIARGSLVVESSVKKVQHPTGGIVGALLVEEGSSVNAGDVLIRLDDTVPRATLNIVRSELDTQLLRKARLTAERDGAAAVVLPEVLGSRAGDESIVRALAAEEKLFEARRNTLSGQRSQFAEQVEQLKQQIGGLDAQQKAKAEELARIAKELAGVQALYDKNLTTTERLTALERNRASLEGERGQIVAAIAAARGKVSEIELQILQLDKSFRTDVLNDLGDAEAKVSELTERQTAAEDQLRRIEIRAPQNGIVHGLAVHTVGGVVGAGDTLMMIVPRADALVVDAMVAPEDVDQVSVGSPVTVRIMAGNRRTTPVIGGKVTRVAPDLLRNPDDKGASYLVRAAFDKNAMAELGDFRIVAGMPAEVFIATGERTPLQYLLQPLGEQIAHTFRER